jgi:hypothetical protein
MPIALTRFNFSSHEGYEATHGRDNQHDSRSYDERFPDATPGKKLDCSASHDSNSNVNTITGCRYVPR